MSEEGKAKYGAEAGRKEKLRRKKCGLYFFGANGKDLIIERS